MVRGWVGMDPNACWSGWGWIQTARGPVEMGLKSCHHAELWSNIMTTTTMVMMAMTDDG